MPPSPPAGWQIPFWLQVVAIIAIILTPFLTVLLNYWLKDRRAATASEGQALVDDQQGFIDKILKAAEMAPQLMEKNEQLMETNANLRAEIKTLNGRIEELEKKVQHLEEDRDRWRDQATRVPLLEGQLTTYEKILREKSEELDRVKAERDDLAKQLAAFAP